MIANAQRNVAPLDWRACTEPLNQLYWQIFDPGGAAQHLTVVTDLHEAACGDRRPVQSKRDLEVAIVSAGCAPNGGIGGGIFPPSGNQSHICSCQEKSLQRKPGSNRDASRAPRRPARADAVGTPPATVKMRSEQLPRPVKADQM